MQNSPINLIYYDAVIYQFHLFSLIWLTSNFIFLLNKIRMGFKSNSVKESVLRSHIKLLFHFIFTHFIPLVSFNTLWKHQKTRSFIQIYSKVFDKTVVVKYFVKFIGKHLRFTIEPFFKMKLLILHFCSIMQQYFDRFYTMRTLLYHNISASCLQILH